MALLAMRHGGIVATRHYVNAPLCQCGIVGIAALWHCGVVALRLQQPRFRAAAAARNRGHVFFFFGRFCA